MTATNDSNPWWSVFNQAITAAGGKLSKREILASTTDAKYIRQLGIPALGFSPMTNTPILLHDHNEVWSIYCSVLIFWWLPNLVLIYVGSCSFWKILSSCAESRYMNRLSVPLVHLWNHLFRACNLFVMGEASCAIFHMAVTLQQLCNQGSTSSSATLICFLCHCGFSIT